MKSKALLWGLLASINFGGCTPSYTILRSNPDGMLSNARSSLSGKVVTVEINRGEHFRGRFLTVTDTTLTILSGFGNQNRHLTLGLDSVSRVSTDSYPVAGAFLGIVGGLLVGIPIAHAVSGGEFGRLGYAFAAWMASTLLGGVFGSIAFSGEEYIFE